MITKKTAIFFVSVAILFSAIFLIQSAKAQQPCASAGQQGDVYGKKCCSGLTNVPINKAPVNGVCLSEYPPYGTQFLCIKIGDGACGTGENKCNSPKDCGQQAGKCYYDECKVYPCPTGAVKLIEVSCSDSKCNTGSCVNSAKPVCGNGVCEGNENNTHQVCTTNLNPVCYDVENCAQDCNNSINNNIANDKTETDKSLIDKISQILDQIKRWIFSLFGR